MRKLLCLLAFAGIGLLSYAQNSNVIKDNNAQVRNVKGFHAIHVSNGIDLYLSQGNEAVAVSASNTDYRDKIKTEVEDGVLKIYIEHDGMHFNFGWHNAKLKAYVSVATLDQLEASGGSDVYLQGSIKTNKLEVGLSGGSDMKGSLEVADLSINQSGGSDVDIKGKVTNLDIEASGGSDFNGYDLVTDNCRISASGGSDTHVTVNKELSANASGGSDIFYKGQGVIKNMKSSGSSSISKKG
ncbi:MAG TPA: head GIN domain-containing protein [Puia sp.]|nr:head GIN domain-containing protein [Puia sp.]